MATYGGQFTLTVKPSLSKEEQQLSTDSGDNCEKNMCQESRLPGKRPLAAHLLDTKAELKGSREDVRKLQSLARHDGKAKK